MKRFLLLTYLLSLAPVFCTGQISSEQKEEMIGMSLKELILAGYDTEEEYIPNKPSSESGAEKADCSAPYIPVDPTYTPVPRNDDGSLYIPDMGFTFSFCGTSYADCFINTNGNVSFGQGVAQFSPDGFPYNVPMVAPFWADVDTRNTACGQAWYQFFGNYMIVSWEDVGLFSMNCSLLNTFQVIISDGTAPIIGVGNNIQFRYGDMNWTTGTASGGTGGFGGSPATVGYNSGDNINFEQLGRFNVDGSNYDGPFGANDGVHYLDFNCEVYNAGPGTLDLTCIDITRSLDANCSVTIIPEDVSSVTVNGCAASTVSIDITDFGCDDIGVNTVTISASDGTFTETCTANVTIVEGACSAATAVPAGPFCDSDTPTFLSASPPGGTWSANAAGGVFDPSVGQGFYTVTYTNPNACPTTADITIEVYQSPEVTINPSPAAFCEEVGFIDLFATGTGGDGNYTYSWNTPDGSFSGPDIVGFTEGSYVVSIVDGNGCDDIFDLTVIMNPTPFVTIIDPGPICEDEFFLTLSGTPSGGTWTGPDISAQGELFPSDLGAGAYTYTYAYTDGFGCEGADVFDLDILGLPAAIAYNTGPFCEGGIIELFGETDVAGGIFQWTGPNGYSSGDQNPTDGVDEGLYLLQVISPNGCISTEVETIVQFAPGPDADALNDGPYCTGEIIALFGTTSTPGTTTYEWAGPNGYVSYEQNPTNATDPGFYSLIINVDGCASPEAFTEVVLTDAPNATASNTGPYCQDESIVLFSSTDNTGTTITYSWTGPNGYTSTDQNPTDAFEAGDYTVEVTVDGCIADPQLTNVVLNQATAPAITGNTVYCEGENTLLDAGTGYTGYSWSNGDITQTTTINTPGNYTVTITDGSGCTAETSVVIEQNPVPVPTILGSSTFCEGSSSLLDAGLGYTSYIWSTGALTQTITVNTSDDFGVTVTDANGCTGEANIVVTENTSLLPVIDGDDVYCEGESTLLDAGGGFETYVWTGGDQSQAIIVTTPGTYGVTVSDASGCTGEATMIITENPLPAPNIQGMAAFCEGETSELIVDGSFTSYLWSDNSSSTTLNVNASGTYGVTVTDAAGCTGEAVIDVTVNIPSLPTLTGATSFCEGNNTIIDAGNGYATYAWSSGDDTQTIDVTTGGTYTVTVTDNNGCTVEEQIIIVENTSLTPQITGVLTFCEGETSTLDAGGGYETYLWSESSTSQTIPVDATGNYSVTVSDANGCTGEIAVVVTENVLPQVNIEGIAAICDGESTELSADGVFDNYEWSDNSTGQTITVDAAGTYDLMVTDGNGCTAMASINVSLTANPQPVIAGSTTFCEGGSASLDAGAGYNNYLWSNGSTEQTIVTTTANTFTVTVTNASGCTGEATTTITESSSLNPVISGDLSFCEGGNSLLNAGAGFETYLWSDASEEQTLLTTTPGDYTVTVSDASGCTGETTITIVENNTPTINVLGNAPACEGETIALDAGGGFVEYLWSDQSLNQTLNVTGSGTYTVTVTDGNGCTAEETVQAVVNENPTPAILGATTFCTGSEVTLSLDEGYDSYLWSNGLETESILINTGGDYSVIVTLDSGCTAETEITVTQNDNLEPTIDGDLSFCEGTSTTLTGPTGFTYEWSNNMSTQSITVSTTGEYSLLITDATGCTGTTEVSVVANGLPEPTIAGSTTFCTGTSTTLDAGTYSEYLWSDGSIGQTLQVTSANNYSVVVTDINGCTGEAQIDVSESTSLNPAISGDLFLCDGETSTLDAGTGFATYLWSTGVVTPSISTNVAGDYSVTVSDVSGCTGEGTVALVINNNPTITISGETAFCGNENSLLDAGSGYSEYLWTNGTTDQLLPVTATGDFGVTVTDANGCTAEDILEVTQNQNPVVEILGPSSFCSGNSTSLTLSDTYTTYEWSTGETTPAISITIGMDVSVVVTDANGCTGEAAVTITENTELTPIVTGALSFCEGENTVLDVGTGWATYEWSTGATTPSITVTTDGNYEVIITDDSGCSGSATLSVATTSNPEPIIAGSTTFCTGNSTTLDAGNYTSWSWSTGDVTQSIQTSVAGDYLVTVTDVNGCTGIANTMVEESSSLNPVISGVPAYCEGESTLLDAGTGFATYAWSDGSVAQVLEVNEVGDFTVTVTDSGGCSGETTIAVTEVNLPTATLQNNAEICNTELSGSFLNLYDLVIDGDMNGTWEDADNSGASGLFSNINFDGVSEGEYSFIYTTNSAITPCPEITYPIVVTVIECSCAGVNFLPVDPICNSDGLLNLTTTIITNEPGTWSIQNVPTGTNPAILSGTDFDATGSDPGEYTLQYQYTNPQPPNCPDVFTQIIEVDQEVTAGVADAPLSFCEAENNSVTLADMVIGEDANGVWTESSVSPSQGTAFDPTSGNFNTVGQTPGTYTFQYEVTAASVCPAQNVEVSVTINEQPTAIAGSEIELTCNTPSSVLNANGSSSGAAYDITWNGPGVVADGNETTLTPTVSASGIYELVITNSATGCSASDVVEVTESSDVPVALAGLNQEITCNNSTTILQPGQSYGPEYLIEWSGPGITPDNMNELNPEVTEDGTYTLVVTLIANGCTSSPDEVEVLDNTTLPEVVTNTPLSSINCSILAVDLIVSSPGTDLTYEWTDANGTVLGANSVLSGIDQEGNYTVLVTNTETGCFATEVLQVVNNVTDPIVNINAPMLLDCNNTNTILDGSGSESGAGIIYSWTGPGVSGSSATLVTEANTPGIYTLQVLDSSNGCTSESSITVEQDTEAPTAVIATPNELNCETTEVSLNGFGSSAGTVISYQWLDATSTEIGTDLEINVGITGEYQLLVTDNTNGCTAIATTTVVQNEEVPEGVLLDVNMPWCNGESNGYVTITGVEGGAAPYTYSFDGSTYINDDFYPELSAGTYDLSLEDANGCQWDTTIVITEPDPIVFEIGLDLELSLGDSALINAATTNLSPSQIDTIIWWPGFGFECENEDCSSVSFHPSNTMLVSAEVIDINGCSAEDQLRVNVDIDRKVFIPTAFSPNGDQSNDVFVIYADEEQVEQVNFFRVFNRWGEIVFEYNYFDPNDEEFGWNGEFKGKMMNPGVFVYVAEIEFIDGHVEQYQGDVTIMK